MVASLDNEISLIQNGLIRRIVILTLERAPNYFWEAPSSSSGKHHPPDEFQPRGNILHTKRVVKVGVDICRALKVSPEEEDFVIAATILHDICKFGYPDNCGHVVQEHGALVAQVMVDAKILDVDNLNEDLIVILNLISTHMGRWGIPYDYPRETLAFIVHLADYIASREYITVSI